MVGRRFLGFSGGIPCVLFDESTLCQVWLLAVSHGFDNHLLRPFIFDFIGGLPCVLLVEPTQFHFSVSCSESAVSTITCSAIHFRFLSGGFHLHFFYVFPFSISIILSFRIFPRCGSLGFDFISVSYLFDPVTDWHMPAGESNVCCGEIAGLAHV